MNSPSAISMLKSLTARVPSSYTFATPDRVMVDKWPPYTGSRAVDRLPVRVEAIGGRSGFVRFGEPGYVWVWVSAYVVSPHPVAAAVPGLAGASADRAVDLRASYPSQTGSRRISLSPVGTGEQQAGF